MISDSTRGIIENKRSLKSGVNQMDMIKIRRI